jgi:outer membrane autotransporter protein
MRSEIYCANPPYVCANGSIVQRANRQGHSKIRLFLLATVCLAGAMCDLDVAQAQSGPLLYVPNAGDNNVSVIDTSTNVSVPPPIVTGVQPVVVGVRGDQSLAYVTNMSSNTVSVINTATNLVVATVNVGSSPAGLAVNPTGTRVYIGNTSDGTISVINTATNSVDTTIVVGIIGSAVIAFTPDGTRAYVANMASSSVSVINAATNTVIGSPIPVGNNPFGLSVSPDGTRVYVVNNTSDTVSVINTATNTVVSTFAVGSGPLGVAVNPNGTRAFVTNRDSNTVSVIDTATNTVVATISVGANPFGVSFSPDGTRAYVTNQTSNDVAIIDTANNTVISTVSVGQSPVFPGICSNGNALLGAGLSFKANTSGALSCTLASGPAGSPGPVFTGGTLQIAGANISSSLPITLQSQGGTVDTNGNNATLSGAISGPGGLSKVGAGTLTLSGQSTYTGATGVNAGTLQAGAVNAFSPFSAFTVASGATLDLASFNQAIGSLAGAGGVTLGSATLTTGNDNTSTIFSGTISGTGGLTKVGSGMLLLTGANTYAGPTNINAGILDVNGSLASTVFVNAGGTLMGNGTIGGLNVLGGGTIAPGNSIGTLNVAGNVSFAPGSIYQVEANAAGQSDKIVAGGTAALTGGSVQVLAQNGTYARQTRYTILTASSGVSNTFTGVTSNFAFLTPSLSYDPNNVYLLLFQNSSAFAAGAQTPNQYAVGVALDQANATATGDLNTVLNAMSVLSNTQGPAALNAISGQPYADFGTLNVQGAALFMNAVGQQMALARGSAAAAGQRQALAQACEIESCDAVSPWGAWASALGGLGSVAGNGNSSTLTYNFGGGAAGIDYRLDPRFLVGLGAGYTAANQWVDSFMGRGWSDSVSVTAYGSFTQAGFYTDALAGYAYSGNQMQRQILIPGLQPRTANGSTGANQFLGQVESGYKLGIYAPALATLTPFGRFQVTTVNQNGFSEWGSANSLNLNVAQQTTTSLRSTFGAELAGAIGLGDSKTLGLALRLGWMHEYADTGRPITAAFAGAPSNAFTVYGATPQRDSAIIGFLASTSIAAATSLYLRYDGSIGNGTDNHTLNVGVRVVW